MYSRSSLLKRAAVPLLAVAAATLTTSLCAPARAATASWADCEAGYSQYYGKVIYEQVECVVEGANFWQTDVMHDNRLGGGDDHQTPLVTVNNGHGYPGPGDYYDPQYGQYGCPVQGGGTYNCWCICSGQYYEGPNSGQRWDVSTGGTKYVTF